MRKKSKPVRVYTHYYPVSKIYHEAAHTKLRYTKRWRKDMFPRRDWFNAARDRTLSRQMYGRIPYRNPLSIKPIIDPALYYAEDLARLDRDMRGLGIRGKKRKRVTVEQLSRKRKLVADAKRARAMSLINKIRRREQTGKRHHVPRGDYYNGYKYANITGWLS